MMLEIRTGNEDIDRACELAARTLKTNVSEKWGRICPTLAPVWSPSYPAWTHPFDNFWMNKVTPYLYPKDQVEWTVILFSKYQRPTGMIGWGVHDCDSPEATQAQFTEIGLDKVIEESVGSRYIRDHLYIIQVHDLWWHYGDLDLARELFPSCRKSFEYLYSLKDQDGDGLIETADIIEDIDIGSTQNRTGPNDAERFVEQSMLYGALVHYAKLADALGESSEAETARSRASDLAKKVNDLYWNEKGYYIFALDSKTHERLHEETTSTYGNGYGVLWGLVPPERVDRVLDYLTSWEFEVPGPVIVPPLDVPTSHLHKEVNLPPGVYANGGCGWGRGYMPSVCLALFARGREDIANSYIRKMAKAANQAEGFFEYWTWEKYTGHTTPRGCRDYSETASAFLDSVIHGYFGLSALEPGWKSLRFAPRPIPEKDCSITLDLPSGDFTAELKYSDKGATICLKSGIARIVEVEVSGFAPKRFIVKGEWEVRMG